MTEDVGVPRNQLKLELSSNTWKQNHNTFRNNTNYFTLTAHEEMS